MLCRPVRPETQTGPRAFTLFRGVLAARYRCTACGCTHDQACAGGCGWASWARCTSCVGRPARLEYVEHGDVVAIRITAAA